MHDIRIAAVSMKSVVGETSENLARMEKFVEEAHQQAVKLICFPEMCITGYSIQEDILPHGQRVPGPASDLVVGMAKRYSMAILAGLAEKMQDGSLCMSHFVAGPEGILGVYRKIHLGLVEQRLYRAGNRAPIFEFNGLKFGIELCYDSHFPELSTMLAIKGAEAIFIPHASPQETPVEKRDRWMRYLAARAYDNSLFVVTCNQADIGRHGLPLPGVAMIIDPRGRVIKEFIGGGEGIIIADLKAGDLLEVRGDGKRFFLRHRRPEVYGDLVVRKKNMAGNLVYDP
jgi:predicted amidohydrolase